MRKFLTVFILTALLVPCVYADYQNPYFEISKGNVAGHRFARRFGDLESVDTVWQDVWIPGGDYVYPTVADFVNVSSTDIDDTSGGSGARTVFLQGLDENYDIVNETLVMNGLTNVTSSNRYIRFLTGTVRQVGATGYNEGDISFTQNNLLLGIIEIEDGKTQSALFTIPHGYKGYLLDCYFTSSEDKTIEYEISYRCQNQSWVTFIEVNTYREGWQHKFSAPVPVGTMCDIRIRVKAGSSSGEVGAGLVLVLVEDGYELIEQTYTVTGVVDIMSTAFMVFCGIAFISLGAAWITPDNKKAAFVYAFSAVFWVSTMYQWAVDMAGTDSWTLMFVFLVPLTFCIVMFLEKNWYSIDDAQRNNMRGNGF